MFRSYWFKIVAVVGLTLLPVLGQTQEQEDDGEYGSANKQNATEQLSFSIPIQIIEDDESAKSREAREDEAEQREINDLIAQQGMNSATQAMNDATQRMAQYALWSTLIVAFGTLLLLWTLCLTRGATKAALEAVDATREIGSDQSRVRTY